MAIDHNIITRGMGRVEIEPRSNALARMLKVQGAQQDHEMNSLTLAGKRRDMADEDQMRDLTRQAGGDVNKLRDLTYRSGNYRQGAVLDKTIADRKTSELAHRKSELEGHLQTFAVSGQIMSGVNDQRTWDIARQKTAQILGPEAAARMPALYDPAEVERNRQQSMPVKEQMEQELRRLTLTETQRHNRATEATSAGQLAETKRHHGVTEGNQATTLSKPFEVTGPDGVPVLVRQDKQGNISRVDGFGPKAGTGTAGTEGERNAAGYASRMTAAEKLIEAATAKDPKSQKPGFVEQLSGGTGMAANATRSPVRQEYRQAQEDWVRAKLRKESGAAIPNDEMEREITVYFPQINDKPGVIAQKAAARKVAEKAMQQAAGRAYKANDGVAPGDFGDDPLGLRNGR